MPKRDRRLEIMQAAEKLFASRRFHEITLDDVTRQAGVGKGTIYRYFRDKDDLFLQTAMNGFDELCQLLQKADGNGDTFGARLLGACEQISAFLRRRRPLFSMMQTEEFRLHSTSFDIRKQWKAHRQKLVDALGTMLARGASEGALRSDIEPKALACLLQGMLRTYVRELNEADGTAVGLSGLVDFFLNGAGPVVRPQSRAAAVRTVSVSNGVRA